MSGSLYDLTLPYQTISIIGMCKNAGKTTVLNYLIENSPIDEVLGLTSIGRDGESVDMVTGTSKPKIYIKSGSLFATAKKLLSGCDVTKEIVDTTDISTSLGNVVIIRARSDGYIELAGPSIVSELIEVTDVLRGHGASRIFIDGSISRKTLSTHLLAEGTILSTGAGFSPDMDETISETIHTVNLFTTAMPDGDLDMLTDLSAASYEQSSECKFLLIDDKRIIKGASDINELIKELRSSKRLRYIYVSGALTDNILMPLLQVKLPSGLTLVTADATKLLISRENMERLDRAKIAIRVLNKINLIAITINPYSPQGFNYDKTQFLQLLQSKTKIPVFNVE